MYPVEGSFVSPFALEWQWKQRLPGARANRADPPDGSALEQLFARMRSEARSFARLNMTACDDGTHAFKPLPQGAFTPIRLTGSQGASPEGDHARRGGDGAALTPFVLPQPDPAWKAASIREQDAAIERIARQRGMSVYEYVDAANARIADLVGQGEIFVRLPAAVLLDFLREGRWASRARGVATSVAPSLRVRAAVERALFGAGTTARPHGPGYGYLAGPDGAAANGMLSWYGDIALRLQGSLRSRASFMIGDSADFADHGGFVPQPLTDLSEAYRANPYRRDPTFADHYAPAHPELVYSPDPLDHRELDRVLPYLEVQLHPREADEAAFSIADVAEIVLLRDARALYRNPRNAFRDPGEAEQLLGLLRDSGLSWRPAQGVSLGTRVRGLTGRVGASVPAIERAREPLALLRHYEPQEIGARRITTHREFFIPDHPRRTVKLSDPMALDADATRSPAERLAMLRAEIERYRAGRALLTHYFGEDHLADERIMLAPNMPFDTRVWVSLQGSAWPQAAPGIVDAPAIVRVQERLPLPREPFFHVMHRSGAQQTFPSVDDLTAACALWLRGEGDGSAFDARLFDRVERNSSSISDLVKRAVGDESVRVEGFEPALRQFTVRMIDFQNETGLRPLLYTRALFVQRDGMWTYRFQDGLTDPFTEVPQLGANRGTIERLRAGQPVSPEAFGKAVDEIESVLVLNAMSHALGERARIRAPWAELVDRRFVEQLLHRWEAEDWEMGWNYDVRPRAHTSGEP